ARARRTRQMRGRPPKTQHSRPAVEQQYSPNTKIYAAIYGISPRDVRRHKDEQLALLLLRAGCGVFDYRAAFKAALPGESTHIGLRAARNRARRKGLLRGLLTGTVVPAIRLPIR